MPPKKVIVKRGLASYDNGVIDVACPHPRCQQPAGKRCMNTAGGLFAQTAHRARVIAAAERRANGNQDVLRTEDVSDASNASS